MKSKTIKFILVFFNIVMFSSLGWSQCDGCSPNSPHGLWDWDSWGWIPCDEFVINIEDCDLNDLQVIQDIITQNNLNEDGEFDPIDFGVQYWENGRLVGLEPYGFGYNLTNLPESIGNLNKLTYLDLDEQLIETLPSTFGNLNQLEILYYGFNSVDIIPESIFELTNLKILEMYSNNISELPEGIRNLINLTILDLQSNLLTGSIPSDIGQLTNLTELWLNGNQLNGEIPSFIGNLTNLTVLYLSSNELTGEIPSEILNITSLINHLIGHS